MNDPGAEGAIGQAESEVEPHTKDEKKEPDPLEKDRAARHRQNQDYRDPSLWWFASTGCPLLAGTFGPLANAFSICSLARPWRVYIPPGQQESFGDYIADPKWLDAINGVSLAFALIANLTLLLNMAQRLRFAIAQPISVIGFFLAGILLLVDVVVFTDNPHYHLSPDDPAYPGRAHALSGAIYYAEMAIAIYFLVTILLLFTSYGYLRHHFDKGFRLTMAQRTLMLQTMAFLVYLLLGALVFSHVEQWEYLDALYWADLTLLTIGLGSDFHPQTHTGRTLLFFFAIGGIIIIGLVIGSIRSLALDRGTRKISARMLEKKRLAAIRSINPKKQTIKVGWIHTMKFDNDQLDERKRRELEFKVMRKIQKCTERDRKWMALSVSTVAAMMLWLIGAVIFFETESPQDWSYFDSMYFTYTCLTTIGYGDLYPESFSGKAVFILWTLLAIPTLTILISDMSDTVVHLISDFTLWIGSITVLPDEKGFRKSLKLALKGISKERLHASDFRGSPPGILGVITNMRHEKADLGDDEDREIDDVTERLLSHLEESELAEVIEEDHGHTTEENDRKFYHTILAREMRNLMLHLNSDPPKEYNWREWEYFLQLMDDENEDKSQDHPESETRKGGRLPTDERHLIPAKMRRHVGAFKPGLDPMDQRWTWLSRDSPLLAHKSETEWVLERLGAALERELRGMRRKGAKEKKPPPVRLSELIQNGDVNRWRQSKVGSTGSGDSDEKVDV